jgi:hypothetical protein
MFRTGESRPVSGAPSTPGPWCSHGRLFNFGHHCRLPAAGPVPRCRFHLPGSTLTRLAGVHHIHPSDLSLACDQWMEHRSLGFLPGFTPRRCQRRMPGAGTSVEHSLGANRRTFSTLHFGYLTHNSATSRRTEEDIQPTQRDGHRIGRAARWFPCGNSFSARPSSEPRRPVSEHVAL